METVINGDDGRAVRQSAIRECFHGLRQWKHWNFILPEIAHPLNKGLWTDEQFGAELMFVLKREPVVTEDAQTPPSHKPCDMKKADPFTKLINAEL
jgi:hypothetical protein